MPIPNAKDAVEHYRTQVPELRADFARRLQAIEHTGGSVDAITNAKIEEVRKRMGLAERSLHYALDAGWLPSEDELSRAFTDCFNPSDYRYSSFDDLGMSLAGIIHPSGSENERRIFLAIGEAQVQSSQKAIAALRMELRRKIAHAADEQIKSSHGTPGSAGESISPELQLLQHLDQNGEDVPSLQKIVGDTGIEYSIARDELVLLESRGLVRAIRPDGYPVEQGRFLLTDSGRAMLAAYRKRSRPSVPLRKDQVTDAMEEVTSKTVFVTHGRDPRWRESVKAFLYDLGLKPIVLEEQANAGQTIIEKYEKHSNAAYSIAILTPDDVGCLQGQEPDGLQPRARQNVIFELGYMYAKISRHRVAVLITDRDIEKPSNIEGIAWISMDDSDSWKWLLRVELKDAGLVT